MVADRRAGERTAVDAAPLVPVVVHQAIPGPAILEVAILEVAILDAVGTRAVGLPPAEAVVGAAAAEVDAGADTDAGDRRKLPLASDSGCPQLISPTFYVPLAF